ncbi:MAG: S8 family serine peptidase [Calditrichota bacterium]
MLGFIIILTFAFAQAAPPEEAVWVFFRDKGFNPTELTSALEITTYNWPARSLQRRVKNDCAVAESDLPVRPEYLEEISARGISIRQVSRWLNAASVTVRPSQREWLQELPFVTAVKPVKNLQGDETGLICAEELTASEMEAVADELSMRSEAYSAGVYGPSWAQAQQAGAVAAHRRGLTGRGVLIGMLDTGFNLDHIAFTGLDLVDQHDFIFNDPDPAYDSTIDPPGQANHGTACLSVITGFDPGKLVGIAPNASVALAKTEFTGSETRVEEDYWVAGVEWLEWLGVDVISSSLTYRNWYSEDDYDGRASLVTRAAQRAYELGVVVCISAGNGGPAEVTIGAPADATGVLGVAAVDSTGQIARFSSRGPSSDGRIKPDVAARGRSVVCVSPMTYNRYARWNGTSLACPIVAGAAALVCEAHPDWPADRVVEALRMTASQWDRPDYDLGYGLINVIEALDYPQIRGSIISLSTGKAVSGLNVSLLLNDRLFFQDVSSRDGGYRFNNVPPGIYRLTTSEGDSARTLSVQVPPGYRTDILIRQ